MSIPDSNSSRVTSNTQTSSSCLVGFAGGPHEADASVCPSASSGQPSRSDSASGWRRRCLSGTATPFSCSLAPRRPRTAAAPMAGLSCTPSRSPPASGLPSGPGPNYRHPMPTSGSFPPALHPRWRAAFIKSRFHDPYPELWFSRI